MCMGGDVLLVGHKNDRVPFAVEDVEQSHDLLPGLAVEVSGRLIRKQDGGVGHKGPGNGNALALAARKFVRLMMGAVAQPDPFNSPIGLPFAVGGTDPALDKW